MTIVKTGEAAPNNISRIVKTGEAATRHPAQEARERKEIKLPTARTGVAQNIGFFGHNQAGEYRIVTALAGEGAPTVTDGYVKVAKVPRFQRVAFTVPEGYEPFALLVPIQFEAIVRTSERPNIEPEIKDLEWMAGRTTEPAEGEVKGEPPYVEVYAVNNQGVQLPLVPLRFQGAPGKSQQWFITGIAWDPNPLRDTAGARIRQKATVTLTEIVSAPSALKRNREAREQVKNKYQIVHSTAGENTIRRIAAGHGIPSSWQAILKANANIGNAEKALNVGTKVRIPLTAYRQVPK